MYDWNDLRCFLAVAREGSTLAAARSLGVNQTTVARRIEALQAALGLKLFERGQAGSKITEAGQALVADAEKVERAAAGFDTQAQAMQRGLAGAIRLTANESIANVALVPGVAEFRRLYPGVTVELVVDDRFLDIEKGEADIAIRGTTALADSRLLSRRMSDIDWGLYCSRDYALRHGVPATPADLADHALIGGEGSLLNMPPMQWMFAQAPGAEVHCRSNSLTNLAFAVKAGLGLAPLPFLLADAEPDLVRCLGPIRDFPSAVFVLTRPQSRDLPRIRAFVDFIVPHFQAVARGLLQRGEANQAAAAAFLAEAATARAGRSSA